jgi:hypothetical protein
MTDRMISPLGAAWAPLVPSSQRGRHDPTKPCSDLLQGRKLVRLAAITGADPHIQRGASGRPGPTDHPDHGIRPRRSWCSWIRPISVIDQMISVIMMISPIRPMSPQFVARYDQGCRPDQNRSHRRQALRSSRRTAPEAGTNPRPSGNHSAHGHDPQARGGTSDALAGTIRSRRRCGRPG